MLARRDQNFRVVLKNSALEKAQRAVVFQTVNNDYVAARMRVAKLAPFNAFIKTAVQNQGAEFLPFPLPLRLREKRFDGDVFAHFAHLRAAWRFGRV